MIQSLCLAAITLLPLQEPTDLSRFAPDKTDLLVSVASRSFDTGALHGFFTQLMKAEEGLPALLGRRGRPRVEAALEFTKGWPRLPVGHALQNLAHGGLLIGQVARKGPRPAKVPNPDAFIILGFGTPEQASTARGVIATWLSLGDLFGGDGGGSKLMDSLEQSGAQLVYAPRKDVRRTIVARMTDKSTPATGRLGSTFFGGESGSLLHMRIWLDLTRNLDPKNYQDLRKEPVGAMLFAGLYEGLKAGGEIRMRADLGAGEHPRLWMRVQVPGFWRGLTPEVRQVWSAGEPWVPVASRDQLLRFRVARDFPALVKARSKLLNTRGEAELDKLLQGFEFGFQGIEAETAILPDLAPGITGMVSLGNEADRVQQGAFSYCLPQGLLSLGHKGKILAQKVPGALRLFVLAGNADRKRRGKDLYRIRVEGDDGHDLSIARVATRKVPRPLAASFEPSVTSTDTSLYLSSSPELLRRLFKAGEREKVATRGGLTTGNLLQVDGPNLSVALLQNLDLARAQMVLRQGISYATAEKRLRFVARLLRTAGRLDYRDGFRGDDLEAVLDWRPGSELFDPEFWSLKRRESVR